MAELGVESMLQARVGGDQKLRFAAGFFQQFAIAVQVGDPQRRQAVLLRAERIAGTAEFKIELSQCKPIGRSGKRLQPLAA